MKKFSRIMIGLGTATLLCAADENLERLKSSGEVLTEIQGSPDKSIPTDLLHKAECIVVIPSMKKAGFIFSGKYGRGYASCRLKAGGWSGPAGMRIEGGGFGLQIGGEATDVIMLVMSKKGRDGMLASKFTLGAEASAAAGPVGRDATAQTDATMRADILSWSRSRGIFGGLSLTGGTLRPDEDANTALYSKKTDNKDILTGVVAKPTASALLTAKLTEFGGDQQTH